MTTNVYDEARRVLRERGWCQSLSEDQKGRVCLLMAVKLAGEQDCFQMNESRLALASVISEQWPGFGEGQAVTSLAWRWNDDEDRTLADVDLVLDKAARRLDEQVSP